jgi:hypothetical protein
MITLVAPSIFYFSQGDEENFFRFIRSVAFTSEPYGRGTDLCIDCKGIEISSDEFLTLFAAFKRYGVDCKQLAQLLPFLKASDLEHVKSPEMIWHSDIFP